MHKRTLNLILFVVLSVVAVAVCRPDVAYAEIKFGILPRLSSEVLYGMFKPLAEYLSKETGEKVSIMIPKDFDAFKEGVKKGQFDMAFANPLIYIQLKKEVNITPLVLQVEPKAGRKFRGIIFARNDSGIQKIQDLKGKKLVAMNEDSPAAYMFQRVLISNSGVDFKKDITLLPFAGKGDKVVAAVFNKEADAGCLREEDLEKMKNKIDITQLKTVAYTEYIPNWPIFVALKTDKAVAAKIKAALLKLKTDDPEMARILVAPNLTGFASVSDNEYDTLRHAAKAAGSF